MSIHEHFSYLISPAQMRIEGIEQLWWQGTSSCGQPTTTHSKEIIPLHKWNVMKKYPQKVGRYAVISQNIFSDVENVRHAVRLICLKVGISKDGFS